MHAWKMNTNKPGLPHYTGPNEGWALWVHHEQMLEYCTDFKGRIAYVKRNKPEGEIPTRLQALTYLTPDEIPSALATARTAFTTAWAALDTAWAALDTTWTAYDTACTAATPLLRPLCEQYCAALYRDGALLFTKEEHS